MQLRPILCATTVAMTGLALALTGPTAPAQATEITFSYDFASTGSTLSGTVDGTLLGNNNGFIVETINSLAVDGAAVDLPTISSADDAYLGVADPIEITLDGSYLNIFGTDGSDAFLFSVGDVANYGVAATRGYGGATNPEDYVQANWQASVQGIPEPSSVVLMLTPLGLLARCRRTRPSA